MTDTDRVLAKVRAAATRGLENMTCLCIGEGGRTPVATCKHCRGSGYLVTDETICARAALAMVEQVTWLREAAGAHREAAKSAPVGDFEAHLSAAAAYDVARERLESALRTAVGEKAKGGSVTDDMPSPSMLDGAALGATLDRIRVHCTTCDRPVATPREETTPRDQQNPAICYFNGGLACHKHEVDWRARCLAAEAGKRIDDMLERRVAKANRIADDATFIAHRALVEGLAECERLRAMASTLSAFDILIGAPSKEMTEADLVEAMARLVTDPPSPMMDAREGAAAREQAIRADSAREERERVVACVDAMRASAQRRLDWARKDGDWHIVDRRRLELEVLADVKDGINTAHAPGQGGEG